MAFCAAGLSVVAPHVVADDQRAPRTHQPRRLREEARRVGRMDERLDRERDVRGLEAGRQVGVVALQTRQAVVEAESGDTPPADGRLGRTEGDARAADGGSRSAR